MNARVKPAGSSLCCFALPRISLKRFAWLHSICIALVCFTPFCFASHCSSFGLFALLLYVNVVLICLALFLVFSVVFCLPLLRFLSDAAVDLLFGAVLCIASCWIVLHRVSLRRFPVLPSFVLRCLAAFRVWCFIMFVLISPYSINLASMSFASLRLIDIACVASPWLRFAPFRLIRFVLLCITLLCFVGFLFAWLWFA